MSIRPADDYPNDADGDALRRVASDGSDMAAPMQIDFHIACPGGAKCEQLAEKARQIGYDSRVYGDVDDEGFDTVECSRVMVPDYDALIVCQRELDEIAGPFGGYVDGWGTFGNKDAAP